MACASVVTVSVLATPGTPSSSTWPQPERVSLSSNGVREWPQRGRQQPANQHRLTDDDPRGLSLDDLERLEGFLGCYGWRVGRLSQVHSKATNAAAASPAAARR